MRILAKTTNFEIEERQHNNNKFYVVWAYGRKLYNKFYNKHDAFKFCYEEIKYIPFN